MVNFISYNLHEPEYNLCEPEYYLHAPYITVMNRNITFMNWFLLHTVHKTLEVVVVGFQNSHELLSNKVEGFQQQQQISVLVGLTKWLRAKLNKTTKKFIILVLCFISMLHYWPWCLGLRTGQMGLVRGQQNCTLSVHIASCLCSSVQLINILHQPTGVEVPLNIQVKFFWRRVGFSNLIFFVT